MKQPGRPREFDPEETLSKIMQLFWENGYEATGLSDIIAATGLGKASLYKTFGNKHEMYLKALAHYDSVIVDGAVAILRSVSTPPIQRIDTFLATPIVAVRDHNDHRGCFICNAAADRASLDPKTGAMVQHGYAKMRRGIIASLSEALPEFPQEIVKVRAEVVLTVYTGLRIMARAGQPTEAMMATKESIIQMLSNPTVDMPAIGS